MAKISHRSWVIGGLPVLVLGVSAHVSPAQAEPLGDGSSSSVESTEPTEPVEPAGPTEAAESTGAAESTAPAEVVDADPTLAIRQANEAQARGDYSEAARLYDQAYRSMTFEQRASDFGRLAFTKAVGAYRRAYDQTRDLALYAASRALHEQFIIERKAAGLPVPAEVDAELARLDQVLGASAPEPEPKPEPKPEPAPMLEPEPLFESQPEPEPEPVEPRPEPDHRVDPWGVALTGAGAIAVITGVVLVAVGAPLRGRAEDYRNEQLAGDDFDSRSPGLQQSFAAALDDYVDGERRRGVGLMASGGAVLGLGVAAVVVGSLRLARGPAAVGSGSRARHPRLRIAVSAGRAFVGVGRRF
ncbi:MAG: hypothetical protein AAGF11_31000 [Myxococcota bacterium]